MGRKKVNVNFAYDSESKEIIANFLFNMVSTNSGEYSTEGPNLNVIRHSNLVLKASKECLDEMLELVNQEIARRGL